MHEDELGAPSWLRRLPKPPPAPLASTATAALALCSGGMLALAMPEIVGTESVLALIKSGVIAVAATVTTYAVTRLAVEKGAPQTAVGLRGSAVVSVLSMLTIGAGLFASTYAGLTLRGTEALRLGDYGRALAAHADERGRSSVAAGRAAPVLRSIVDDLRLKEQCERRSSCLSGRAEGGAGPVTRALGEKRQRAETILDQMSKGETARARAIERLGTLLQRYQDALNDADLDDTGRRKALQAIVANAGTQLSALDEAVPTALLGAYAEELRTPVVLPDQSEVAAKLTDLLQGYANGLSATLRGLDPAAPQRPVFPGRTGVADTFSYLGHFIPIAAVVGVVELVFPISLWLYTLFGLQARLAQQGGNDGTDEAEPGGLASLLAMKPAGDGARDLPRRQRPPRPE